jgi:ketosteroid isomerase-like protein
LPLASPATPRPGEILKDVIQRLTSLFVASLNKPDIEAALTYFAPDAVMLAPGRPGVKGKPAIGDLLREMVTSNYLTITLGRNSMAHLGDLAVEIGDYTMNVTQHNGNRREEAGKYVTAWRRQPGGEFMITVTVWSRNP